MTNSVRSGVRTAAGRLRENVEESVRVDTRTLAVFRMFVGLLIVVDVLLRSRNFTYFYTNDGVVPQSLATQFGPDNAFSFYHFTTDPTLIAALMGIQILIAIQLIVGYKTRIATILSFLFVISLDHHNPFVLSYADTLFRLLLFWAIFLPLGERWSIDAVHADGKPRATIASIASALILGQMVYMYFLNWYHKSQDELWTGGDATPLIMGLDDMTYLFAGYARQLPALLELGTYLWYYMLMFSWLLLVLVGRKRMLLVALFVGGHASFILTVRIGAFPYVAMAGLLLFLQTQFWDDLESVAAMLEIDRTRLTAARHRLEAFGAAVPYPRLERPSIERAKSGLYSASLGLIVVFFVVFSAFAYVPAGGFVTDSSPNERAEDVAASLSVDQPNWSVFAPTPRTTDRYYVFPAETADGDRIDAYNERPLTYDRSHDELQNQYDTYRQRFYMNSVRNGGFNDNEIPEVHAEYLCTVWEEEYDTELTHINMYVVYEDITLETIDDPSERETRTSHLYAHGCGDNEPKEIAPPDF
ncbi:HTTM domain-containing protein [Natronorubrum sp. JWXQ-INN-674]|uniref:HTTM domain-containing protein n=1 Tax=Natronorubrum halalkaliphilum TaxID=2691917 RepID=A0A6B0VJW8_9EURY|nr:HTTM domain-containing protein [Natronorubrum halalkaliphilum]MXV61543.1 HTTM domain-containing protein [Natronorubrum halalkaliphilum]